MHKKILLILIVFGLPILAFGQNDVFAKNITYSCFKKPLSAVLVDLSTATDINIAFDPSVISEEYIISINIQKESLADVLSVILADTNLEYEMLGGQIIITANPLKDKVGKFIFSGYIEDAVSRERLAYANVYSMKLNVGVSANEYGYFSFTAKDSIVNLRFTYLGYEAFTATLSYEKKNHVISMTPNILLNEIIIEDTRLVKKENIQEVNTFPLHILNNMTALGGDPDVIRLAGMQAGVSTGADGLGGINVRGGSIDQNLILMDGVPVYNTGHTLGMFSVFNTSMVKSAKLYKDAFPAKYGGRLSSVLDVRTKEGNLKKFAGDVSLGTISAKFVLEGPIKKDRSSFIISGRRSMIDPWIKSFSRSFKNAAQNDGQVSYSFYDLNAKLTFRVGKSSTFYLSYYEGKDVFGDETISESREDSLDIIDNYENAWNWGNRIGSARLSTKIGKKLFMNSTAYYSQFSFDAFKNEQSRSTIDLEPNTLKYDGSLFQSKITDIGYRLDFNLNANNYHQLQFGLDLVRHQFDPGLAVVNESDSIVFDDEVLRRADLKEYLDPTTESGLEGNLYFEDKIKATDNIDVVLGARASFIRSRKKNYISFLPSVIINSELSEDFLLRLTYSRSNQFLHLLTTSGLGLPTDVWLPTTDELQPERAWQYSASILSRFTEFGHLEIGGFYKNLSQILTLREGPVLDINSGTNWESDIPTGSGLSYGIETTLVKNVGKFKGSASYTWSKATRLFDEVNNGNPYYFRYDRRHMVNTSASYRINSNIEIAMNGLYLTGNPVTVPSQFLPVGPDSPDFISVYTEKNNIRLSDYKRIDVSVNIFNKYAWGRQKLTIGVYNLFNWQNPLFYYVRRNKDNITQPERKQISILPLLPSLSYSLTF
ncbi:TonB-dependent receptor [Portibacter lacus]|uniref:TonB-dependent receptor n=1 Tax=Portibacter lacus TaxID=1099794 RepID=A0AA37SUZ1_9BACT|nr:TonB-dependent receptor [Portibacter lacus]GLR20104.1 TonB-dependent receptor [Portibacter lacus]